MKIPSILFSVLLLVGMAAASPENSQVDARAAFARLKAPLAPTCYAGCGATRKLSRHISGRWR